MSKYFRENEVCLSYFVEEDGPGWGHLFCYGGALVGHIVVGEQVNIVFDHLPSRRPETD